MQGKSPAVDRKLYVFDPTKMLPGDVVLELGSGLRSKAIAVTTGGDYSHALMWIGGTDFIEAVTQGARVISFARVIISDPDKWTMLRLKKDRGTADKASAEARRIAQMGYSLVRAGNTILGLPLAPSHTKVFCSELVAKSYERAGVPLVCGVASDQVTPAMLQKKSVLEEVEIPLRELTPDERVVAQPYLDRDQAYRNTPMFREMMAGTEAYQSVAKAAAALKPPNVPGVHFPAGNLHELLDLLQFVEGAAGDDVADKLWKELNAKDYFTVGRETIVNLHLAIREAATFDAAERAVFISGLHLSAFEQTRDRYRQNYSACMAAYGAQHRKLWLELATMYQLNAMGIDEAIAMAKDLVSD